MAKEAPFYDRKQELSYLKEKFHKLDQGELIAIYGRRRLGKTRLIEKLVSEVKPPQNFYFYINLTEREQLKRDLTKDVNKQANANINIETWADFYEFLAKQTENTKSIIIIDEFQRFNTIDKSAITQLQHYWDSKLKNNPILFILSGSSVGMMKKITTSYSGPLYGRLTGRMDLKPFKYADFRKAFPNLTEEARIEWYSVFGGTPFYVELSQKHENVWQAIENEILQPDSTLREEPKTVLELELRKITRYNAIMQAIASGKHSLKEISDSTGIKPQSLPTYFNTLEKGLNLVKLSQPLFGHKKIARYVLNDPFFSFWYRFILPQSTDIEFGKRQEVLKNIKENISAHEGKVFEDIVKELFIAYNTQSIQDLALNFHNMGTWWNKDGEEIDLVLDNKDSLILVEVKYRNQPADKDVLENLVRKSNKIPKGGLRRFVLVSKNGFTDSCRKLAHQYQAVLLDLNDIKHLYDQASETK
ncbi:ATP-binding protein [Candidatus Micrarchaeota archaeon]|nr:ATP-binding protein [Candidatus Micrarchaeota archaeon]